MRELALMQDILGKNVLSNLSSCFLTEVPIHVGGEFIMAALVYFLYNHSTIANDVGDIFHLISTQPAGNNRLSSTNRMNLLS